MDLAFYRPRFPPSSASGWAVFKFLAYSRIKLMSPKARFCQGGLPLLQNNIFSHLVVGTLSCFCFDDSSFGNQQAGFLSMPRTSIRKK